MSLPIPDIHDYQAKGRIAARSAIRRYNLHPYPHEIPDLIQEATAHYYDLLVVQGLSPKHAWCRARNHVVTYYYEKIRGGRREYVNQHPIVSLDELVTEKQDRHDRIAAPEPDAEPPTAGLPWLTDHQIKQALIAGRQAAGTPHHMIRRWEHLLDQDVAMLRLLAEGHHVDTCAALLGIPPNTVRYRQAQTRRYLKELALSYNLHVPDRFHPDPYRGIRARCAYRRAS